jgi:hypothetical protein
MSGIYPRGRPRKEVKSPKEAREAHVPRKAASFGRLTHEKVMGRLKS